ncbi:winged helix-turn-helix transcriptional regulator [Micromonospora sp. NPDC003197]
MGIPAATAAALELFGRRWTTELLYLLCQGEARFGELARAIPGISRRILTERLRQLADAGLVDRHDDAGRVTYALTERAAGLRGALAQIHAWASTAPPDRSA